MTSSSKPSPHFEELGNALGAATRPTALHQELTAAVASIHQLFGAAACSCALVEEDSETLRFAAAVGAGADAILDVTLPIGRGIVGWAAMSGEPIAVSDVTTDTRFARDVAESTNYVPTSLLAAPIVSRTGEVLGVLEVLDPATQGTNTGRDLNVLGALASQLATIVQLGGLFDALGTSLVRTLSGTDMNDDAAQPSRVLDPATGVDLSALASTFHTIAASGPDGARLAEQVLASVAEFVRTRR